MAEDIRRRRAERVRQDRFKNVLPQYRNWIIIGVVVLAIAGLILALPKATPLKFAHEHPSFALFIEDQAVSFNDRAYDASEVSGRVHMHLAAGDPVKMNTWHVESNFPNGVPDLTLAQIFEIYGVTFRQGYLKLDTKDGHNGTEWADAGAKTWRVYVSKLVANETGNVRQPFVQLPGDYSAHVPRDLEKILITYGDLTPAQVEAQQAQVPDAKP